MLSFSCSIADDARIADAARELAHLLAQLEDAAAAARAASDEVRWQARGATAFHERAAEWTGGLHRLVTLAAEARHATAVAGERAVAERAALRASGVCS